MKTKKLPDHPVTFREQYVSCGKGACRRCGGWKLAHGPYWYIYWTDGHGAGRTRYWGKQPPEPRAGDKVAL